MRGAEAASARRVGSRDSRAASGEQRRTGCSASASRVVRQVTTMSSPSRRATAPSTRGSGGPGRRRRLQRQRPHRRRACARARPSAPAPDRAAAQAGRSGALGVEIGAARCPRGRARASRRRQLARRRAWARTSQAAEQVNAQHERLAAARAARFGVTARTRRAAPARRRLGDALDGEVQPVVALVVAVVGPQHGGTPPAARSGVISVGVAKPAPCARGLDARRRRAGASPSAALATTRRRGPCGPAQVTSARPPASTRARVTRLVVRRRTRRVECSPVHVQRRERDRRTAAGRGQRGRAVRDDRDRRAEGARPGAHDRVDAAVGAPAARRRSRRRRRPERGTAGSAAASVARADRRAAGRSRRRARARRPRSWLPVREGQQRVPVRRRPRARTASRAAASPIRTGAPNGAPGARDRRPQLALGSPSRHEGPRDDRLAGRRSCPPAPTARRELPVRPSRERLRRAERAARRTPARPGSRSRRRRQRDGDQRRRRVSEAATASELPLAARAPPAAIRRPAPHAPPGSRTCGRDDRSASC